MNAQRCAERARVDLHFASRISPTEERAMREHLPGCPSCRERYERHLLLEKLDPVARRPQERLASGLGIARPSAVRRLVPVAVAALAAAAAVALYVGRTRPPDPGGFAARGGAVARGSELFVYTVRRDGTAARAGDAIGRGDALSFAYDNASSRRFLLVFGVDENKRVYWYYPAWNDAAEDPRAVAIDSSGGMRYLPEGVAHDLVGQELDVHAVFTDTPVSVKTVEGRMARGEPLAGDGAVERVLRFRVAR